MLLCALISRNQSVAGTKFLVCKLICDFVKVVFCAQGLMDAINNPDKQDGEKDAQEITPVPRYR